MSDKIKWVQITKPYHYTDTKLKCKSCGHVFKHFEWYVVLIFKDENIYMCKHCMCKLTDEMMKSTTEPVDCESDEIFCPVEKRTCTKQYCHNVNCYMCSEVW